MSNVKVFGVYDSKVGAFMQPFFAQSIGHAMRLFEDLANNPKSVVCAHPADFTLFQLAEFNEESGVFKSLDAKLSCATALEVKAVSDNGDLFRTPLNELAKKQVSDSNIKN